MTNANNISYKQLAVLLVLSRLFSEGADLTAVEAGYSMQRFTVILASNLILFLLYLPLIFLAQNYPSENVISLAAGKSRGLGWLCGVFISLVLLVNAVSAMCSMSLYASSTVLSEAPTVLLMLLPLLAAGMAAWKGLQGTARSGVLLGALFVVFLLMIILSIWELLDWEWLYPAFLEEPGLFAGQVTRQVGRNSEILVFAVLMGQVDKKAAHTVYWYIPSVMLLQALKLLTQVLVLGPYLDSVTFPFFTISALSDIVLFQRLDGINVAIWLLICIVKVSLALLCTRTIFTCLVGEKAGKCSVWIGTAIIALTALPLGGASGSTLSMDGIASSWIILLIGGLLIPVIALLTAKAGYNREENSHEKSG